MSKRVLFLVEGQTEEKFVKDVLQPAFLAHELFLFPKIVETRRVKNGPNFKGGMTSFAKFRKDAERILGSAGDALVTTIVDYYRLPSDFPGMDTRPRTGTALQRVQHVEAALLRCFGTPLNFVPFLALHEFEAWLFSSTEELPRVMIQPEKQAEFASIRRSGLTPEEINERPEWAPSKQIECLFPSYKKTLHGPTTASRIGLAQIRAHCPHFNEWLMKLETFAGS